MMISVTAPKKGMGQTQCAINLSGMLTRLINGKVLLGDINKFCQDIEYYFSDTHALKGLDSLISLIGAGLLREDNFDTCIKSINSELDILIANECFELNKGIIESLIDFSVKLYDAVVFDTISGNNPITREFFEKSDVIVVVLNQYKNVVDMAASNKLYKEYANKVIYLLNRFQDKISFNAADVRGILHSAGLMSEIFTLDYDISMINECNDHSVLNYILNKNSKSGSVHEQLMNLAELLIKRYGSGISVKNNDIKSGKLFTFFRK
ncbi:MAG: hypothetical protein Q8942_14295 [Bacillota bacterium]|nr:hypothetical protein [Bacillota bacterium]